MEKDHNGETFWGRQLFERYAPVQIHPQGGVYIPKHFFLLFIVAYNGYGRVCLLAVVFFFGVQDIGRPAWRTFGIRILGLGFWGSTV